MYNIIEPTTEKQSKLLSNIRNEAKGYFKGNISSVVIGMSGGIDSALCAAILKPVCEEIQVPLIGAFIGMEGNKDDEEIRAMRMMESFTHNFLIMSLNLVNKTIVDSIGNSLFKNNWTLKETDEKKEKIRNGNIKARLRMINLYHIAHLTNGLVISTDNLTEYMLGFWTINGDVGDFSPIQMLYKTEVYNLAEHIITSELNEKDGEILKSCIDANATDGLGITNSDLDQILGLGWGEKHNNNSRSGYGEVDENIFKYLNNNDTDINFSILQRIEKTNFKRNHPKIIERNELLK
jgi:NAD+ synthase